MGINHRGTDGSNILWMSCPPGSGSPVRTLGIDLESPVKQLRSARHSNRYQQASLAGQVGRVSVLCREQTLGAVVLQREVGLQTTGFRTP